MNLNLHRHTGVRAILTVAVALLLLLGVLANTAQAQSSSTPSMVCPVPDSTFIDSWGAPRAGHTHKGVDMMAADGTPIYAPESGTYRTHGNDSFYLDGVSGTTYFGTHLQEHVRGDGPVVSGELIALVGHTGNASADAPHLHFEIHPGGGEPVNPYPATFAACNGPSPDQVALQFVAQVGAPPVAPYTPVETADFVEALGHERPTMVESYAAASYFNATERVAPQPTWPYQTGEVRRWWNASRDPDIDRAQAARVTAWLNAVVEARLGQYLLAIYLSRVSTTSCVGGADCAAMIRSVFYSRGLDGDAAVRVATCESTLNPRASNGSFGGLFQQMISAWPSRSATYGMAGRSIWDGYANAVVSAGMVAADGGWRQWSCSPY